MKKTLATLLVVALVASLCGVMFVSAETTNLALGKAVANAENVDASISTMWIDTNLTDGTVQPDWSLDWVPGEWLGYWWNPDYDARYEVANAIDGVAIPTIDLGETCTIDNARVNMFMGNQYGIVPASLVELQISDDGETFTTVASVELTAPAEEDVTPGVAWVDLVPETSVEARYVRIAMTLKGYWLFVDEIEIYGAASASEGGDEPAAPSSNVISVSHVNRYAWECFSCMVITGEGNHSGSYDHNAFDATKYIVIKVENDVVTAVEGAGVAKTLTAPANGYLLYCAPNDATSMAAAATVKVGDVVVECTVDLGTNTASATPIGTITFGAAAPATGDAGVLVFVVLAVVAVAGVAVASKAKSAL